MRVAVYRNLHTGNFSVQHKGRVIFHTEEVFLKDVEFRVSQAGRRRVLLEKCKNVHAKVHGTLIENLPVECTIYVHYNPYKTKYFMRGNKPVFKTGYAHLKDNKVFINV